MAAAFGLAFLFQLSSVLVQRHVVEVPDEDVFQSREPHGVSDIIRILRTDGRMRRFLLSWGFITAASTAGMFFVPAAIDRFQVDATAIGVYTMLLVAAQVFGGVALGWISDRYGTRGPLLVSALSMAVALIIAAVADRPVTIAFAFLAMGVPLGAEMMARYNTFSSPPSAALVWDSCSCGLFATRATADLLVPRRTPTFSGAP